MLQKYPVHNLHKKVISSFVLNMLKDDQWYSIIDIFECVLMYYARILIQIPIYFAYIFIVTFGNLDYIARRKPFMACNCIKI